MKGVSHTLHARPWLPALNIHRVGLGLGGGWEAGPWAQDLASLSGEESKAEPMRASGQSLSMHQATLADISSLLSGRVVPAVAAVFLVYVPIFWVCCLHFSGTPRKCVFLC